MVEPVKELQVLFGCSMLILSLGGSWSMVSGSVVQLRVAGANFSVNRKLEQVEQIRRTLEDTTTELKQQPRVSRRKIKAIEKAIESVEPVIADTEKEIEQDLDDLVNLGSN